jgi:hypothetical protein
MRPSLWAEEMDMLGNVILGDDLGQEKGEKSEYEERGKILGKMKSKRVK